MAILILALIAAVASFGAMGGRDALRARRLQRVARNYAIRHDRDDPYQCPQLYESFLLMRAGHSPRACHVLHGQAGPTAVRLFEYRYEVGHGTHRQTRAYRVFVLKFSQPLPAMLLWNDQDASARPLEVRHDCYRLPPFSARGEIETVEPLAREIEELLGRSFSMETQDHLAMIFTPLGTMPIDECGLWLQRVPQLARALGQPDRPARSDSR